MVGMCVLHIDTQKEFWELRWNSFDIFPDFVKTPKNRKTLILKVGYGLYVYDTGDISKLISPKKIKVQPHRPP